MKRMSAMVLSTICIVNALTSPVATAFADTNGYEVVDLSANSDKLMGAGLAEEETASPSTIAEEVGDSDEMLKRVGDVEKYRTYTNVDKTEFTDVSGRTVYKTDNNESGWQFIDGNAEYVEYTKDLELSTIKEYLNKKEAEEKKTQELKALEAQWSDAKKKYAYLEKDYASSSESSDVKLYVLPDAVTLDMLDFRNYTVFKYLSGEFKDLELHYSEILDFIKRTYPELGGVSIQRAGIANGKYGVVFTATVGDSEENPLYAMKTKLDDGYTWIDNDMRKTWTFFLPVNTVNKDLVFVDASSDRLDIKPNQEISDDVLSIVKKYLIENRGLSSIDVVDKMVKYDAVGKYHYLNVKYVASDSTEPVDARIRFLKVEGLKHDDDNFYIDFSEGKTKLSEADIARLNKSLGVMKDNVFYDFDIGTLDMDANFKDDKYRDGVVRVDFGHNSDLPSYKMGACYNGVGSFVDSDSLIYKHKISVDVPYGHNDFLLTGLRYNDIVDTDLYVYNGVLFKEQVPGSISLNDYVKFKNGGHDIVKLIRFEQGKYYLSRGTTRLVGLSYVDGEGQIKYYMIKLKPEMTTLYFKEEGSRELTEVSERLKTKIKTVVSERLKTKIKDVQVSNTFRGRSVNFAFSYMNDKRVAGQVLLVPVMMDYFPPAMCRPYTKTDVMIDAYVEDKNTGRFSTGYIEYDDKDYVAKVLENKEEPKMVDSEENVSKESPSDLSRDVLTPSEIRKEDSSVKTTPSELPKNDVSSVGESVGQQEKGSKSSTSNSIGGVGSSRGFVRQSEVFHSEKSFEGENDTDVRIVENPSGEVAGVDRQVGVVAGNGRVQLNPTSINSEHNVGIGRNVKTSDRSILFVYGSLFMVSMFGFLTSLFGRDKEVE